LVGRLVGRSAAIALLSGAGISSYFAVNATVERDRAEVALWDAGIDADRADLIADHIDPDNHPGLCDLRWLRTLCPTCDNRRHSEKGRAPRNS
jgi:hypothetical protein